LRRFQKMCCSFRGRRSTLDVSIVIFRGRRSTLDVSCCVFFADRIGRAASSGILWDVKEKYLKSKGYCVALGGGFVRISISCVLKKCPALLNKPFVHMHIYIYYIYMHTHTHIYIYTYIWITTHSPCLEDSESTWHEVRLSIVVSCRAS